jgi:hypothetical protein
MTHAAPTMPPISAWVDDEGMPSHQQKMLHSVAADMAITSVSSVIAVASTRPVFRAPPLSLQGRAQQAWPRPRRIAPGADAWRAKPALRQECWTNHDSR